MTYCSKYSGLLEIIFPMQVDFNLLIMSATTTRKLIFRFWFANLSTMTTRKLVLRFWFVEMEINYSFTSAC